MLIRKPTVADGPALTRLLGDAWNAAYPNAGLGISPELIAAFTAAYAQRNSKPDANELFAKMIVDPNRVYLVAEIDNKPVGFINAIRKSPKHNDAEIVSLYVDPHYFSRGIGYALLTAAFKKLGATNVHLTVASYNERAVTFYERNGFRKIPNSDHLYQISAAPTADSTQPSLMVGKNAIPVFNMIHLSTAIIS